MGFFKSLGKILGITGKPIEWLPGVIAASGDIDSAKEQLERKIKSLILPEIEMTRRAVLQSLSGDKPEKVVNAAFDKLLEKATKFQF